MLYDVFVCFWLCQVARLLSVVFVVVNCVSMFGVVQVVFWPSVGCFRMFSAVPGAPV